MILYRPPKELIPLGEIFGTLNSFLLLDELKSSTKDQIIVAGIHTTGVGLVRGAKVSKAAKGLTESSKSIFPCHGNISESRQVVGRRAEDL